MKALYFDCASGICGSMVLGALLELVEDDEWFFDEISQLHLEDYTIDISKGLVNDIAATSVEIMVVKRHHQYSELKAMINESELNLAVKDLAKKILRRLAKAEGKVRGVPIEKAFDYRSDMEKVLLIIVGTAILINRLAPELCFSSVVNDGYGFIDTEFGTIPVPLPATSEIFAASTVISRQIGINTDLVTPTGAAIIAELATIYGPMPAMDVTKIGWGAGHKVLTIPNILRVSLGEVTKYPDEMILWGSILDDVSCSDSRRIITGRNKD
ncbi:MAG: LarC family nickel insertion protein [Erysipelotrichaceae bacterium]|nr:LarC family nickel insertion protein [Erysipelotrichaceae bacterium]